MSDKDEEGSGSGASGEGSGSDGSGDREVADDVEQEEDAGEEGDAEDEDNQGEESPEAPDENKEGTPEENNDEQEEEETDDPPRRPSKGHKGMDKEEVKNLLRRLSKSETSDGSGSMSGSSSSFDDSIGNRRSIKTLQSSVIRDHELPMKIAYEQLEELAANAEKVKYAIERNRNLLNVQVKKSNSRYLRAAFTAWKLELDWKKSKKRDLEWAKGKWKRSLMSRAFRTWTREHLVNSKVKRLEKSVKNILGRHNLRRTWKAWFAQIRAKIQEDDDRRRERRLVKDLDHKHQDKICRRACNFMYRWRLRRLFFGFMDGCEISRMQFLRQLGIHKLLQKRKLKRILDGWKAATGVSVGTRKFLQTRLRLRTLRTAFYKWRSNIGRGSDNVVVVPGGETMTREEFYQKYAKNVVAVAFAAWAGKVSHRKQGEEHLRRVSLSLNRQLLGRAFDAFVDGCHVSKWRGSLERRVTGKLEKWRLNKYFQAWICFMQIQAQKKMIRLQEHIVQVEKENDRVRQENQRLTHVIDSGDWGRKRIAELLQAGQVLSGERDALTRLLGRMQRQHGFALNQQKVHEEEIAELKNQILRNKHHVRNKLLVKGASSFNSLIKAMKDDVLKNGNDSELLYTIDKLAMDEVTVFPDGDLHVKAVPSFNRGKGSWPSRLSSPGSQNAQVTAAAEVTRQGGKSPTASNKSLARSKTPVQSSSNLQDVSVTPGTPRYVRSRTPIKGRAFGKFDYTQKLDRTREQPVPNRLNSGDRNVVVKGSGYSRDPSPRSAS